MSVKSAIGHISLRGIADMDQPEMSDAPNPVGPAMIIRRRHLASVPRRVVPSAVQAARKSLS